MSVDGFRRPAGRPMRPAGSVRPARPSGPAPVRSALRPKARPSVWSNWLRSIRWRTGRLRLNSRGWRVVAVAVFSVSFFSALMSFLLNPPGAQAAISNGDGLTIYGSTQTGKTTIPQFRNYLESSDAFDSQTDTVSNGSAQSFAIRTSPIKTEAIAAYEISGGTLQIMCYDGTNWSNDWTATTLNNSNVRAFDVAYEAQSGNVVVLYSTGGSGSNELAYRTKPGTAACGSGNWSAATIFSTTRTTGAVDWVDMQNDPNSNNIAAIWADANRDLSARIWNTSSWQNEPSAALETNLAYISSSALSDTETFDLAFESQSGDLMIVWGTGGNSSTGGLRYIQCTGGTATCTWGTNTVMPTITRAGSHVDMSANPQTDAILVGVLGRSSNTLAGAYWSGSAWTNSNSLDTGCEAPTAGRKLVTANWLINGSTTRGILMYSHSNSQAVDYFLLNGTTFGSRQTYGSAQGETPIPSTTLRYLKSRKDPYHLNRVMLEFEDSNSDLFAKHVVMSASGTVTWSDSDNNSAGNFTGALNRNISSSTAGPFGFAYWQFVPTPGPSKIFQDGYIFENDDQVAAAGNQVDGDSVQDVGNTAITGVRQGERLTIRFQMRNTGVDPLTGSLGLFYDRGDGYFVKADDHAPPNTAAGNCTDTIYNCGVVDNAAGTNTGQYTSMAFDKAGQPWVSYYDATNTDLWVAKYVGTGGSGCGASGSTAWTCTLVDKVAATNLGQYTSIGFDASGVPWISYYDVTNTNLKVATLHTDTTTTGTGCGTGSTMWDCTTIDSTANSTGAFSSIAFDQNGNAGMAYTYNNGTTAGTKFATFVSTGGTGCAVTTWTCTVVDSGSATGIDYTSIQYDHSGKPWMVYYDKSLTALRAAQFVGSGNGTGCGTGGSSDWTCSTVDNTGTDTGSYPSLMFGPTGNPWVSFYDATNSSLRVATKGGGFGSACTDSTWTCGQVDNTGTNTGQYTSLASDASGQIIVSYYDVTNTAMRVARYVGGTSGNCTANSGSNAWNCGAVDNTGTATGQYTSAAVAPTGNLWVSFYDTTNTSLRTAQVTRGGEIVPAAGLAGVSPGTITTSQADMTTVSDTANQTDADCLTSGATWNNGVWGSGSEAQSNQTTSTNSILPAGNIAAQCTEVAFTIDTSQATSGQTYRFILASSNSDRADKGLWRGPAGVSNYATLTMASSSITQRFSKDTNPSFPTCDGNSAWGCEAVQSTNSVGQYASMAFDPSGRPWMSYYDATNTAMRVAQYVGTGGTGCATTQWTCIQMENQSGHTTGQYSSMAFGKDGTPWVAYRDNSTGTTGGLKVANRVSSSGSCASIGGSASWNCTVVDNGTGAGTGQYTSVAIAPSGSPWIAYYDSGSTQLKIATYVGSGGTGCGRQPSPAWSCFVVDSGGNYGQSASLGFDGNGTAWIAYMDSVNQDLRLAHYVGAGGTGCASTQWSCSVIDSATENLVANGFTSMSFDSSGVPWVSYENSTNSALMVANYVGTGGNCSLSTAWTCTQVDNTGTDGQYSSLAFDATGHATVSYYDGGNGDLRVANYVGSGGNCTSTAWNCGTINTGSTVGQYTSLAFDHSGNPWVAYYDATNLDLKVAKQSISPAKPAAQQILPAGPRNARTDDGRYHLDNGLAPRSSTGDCNAVVNDMGYCGVANNDGFYDTLYVSPNEQPFFDFALTRSDNSSPTFVQWRGASDVAASAATLSLEVYNISTSAWETIGTNTTCAASSGCTLSGSPSGTLSNYYEAGTGGVYWIYFRVSQAANTTGGLFQTNVFMFAPTTDLLLRHGAWFDPSSQTADRSQPYFWAQ